MEHTLKIPLGYLFAGMCAGFKVRKPDLALILSEVPAATVGCFTQSQCRAPCVQWNADRLPRADARAIVVNSGNANALTGPDGVAANRRMAEAVSQSLNIPTDAVLTCSTGVIGLPLPIHKAEAAMPSLVGQLGTDPQPAAQAMLTTDTCTKMVSRELFLDGKPVKLLGIAKGSGMVHPNMATVLAFVITDAAISETLLQKWLPTVMDISFHMVSIDRDTSTNDAVIVMANGMAENKQVTDEESTEAQLVFRALSEIFVDLAKQVAGDAEGAQHTMTVNVSNAPDLHTARSLAKSVVESTLCKTAVFGSDPNWGRIMSAMGARAAEQNLAFDLEHMTLELQGVRVFAKGAPCSFDPDALRSLLRNKQVTISLDMAQGEFQAQAWGSDLSYDYIRINADYAAVLVDTPDGPVRRDTRLDTKTPDLKAEVLLQALRYIERFSGKRAVVKYGGAAMVRADLKDRFAEDIRLLQAVGLQIILVHGGGPEISRTLDKMGEKSEFIDGLRVTNEGNLKVVEMVLTGQINKEVVSSLARAGARSVGLSGKDGNLILASKKPGPQGKDLGYVGEVKKIDPDVIELLLQKGYVPVISPMGLGEDGYTYNINADTVAAEIAVACKASKLIYLTDVQGIFSQGLLISELSAEELRGRMDDGTITGGMLPKAQSILRALEGNVETVHIIDGRVTHNIVAELFTARGVGTMIRSGVPSEGKEITNG
jgi:acetylglutamate kinase